MKTNGTVLWLMGHRYYSSSSQTSSEVSENWTGCRKRVININYLYENQLTRLTVTFIGSSFVVWSSLRSLIVSLPRRSQEFLALICEKWSQYKIRPATDIILVETCKQNKYFKWKLRELFPLLGLLQNIYGRHMWICNYKIHI